MIIIDAPDSPVKTQQPLPDAGRVHVEVTEDIVPPPAYTARDTPQLEAGSSSAPNSAPNAGPSTSLLHPEAPKLRGEPAEPRFLKAFSVAVLIYALFAFFLNTTINIALHSSRRGEADPVRRLPKNGPSADDGKIIRCTSGYEEWERSRISIGSDLARPSPHVSFELPLSADLLYLFSRGQLAKGNVVITQEADWYAMDTVKVDVSVHGSPVMLSDTSVCMLERKEGEVGVGLFTHEPSPYGRFDPVKFQVRVRFPTSIGSKLHVPAFMAHLPRFTYEVEHLEVWFDQLSLISNDGEISAESLFANEAEIVTTNGKITANVSAMKSLALLTTNEDIAVNATLFNDPATGRSTEVLLQTSNGEIDGIVDLIPSGRSTTGGAYNLTAVTTNGPIILDVPIAPVNVQMRVRAITTNEAASVTLPRTYEGVIELVTSHKDMILHFDDQVEDPAGLQRTRKLSMEGSSVRWASGNVFWDERAKDRGEVVVYNPKGPVVVNLL